MFGAGFDENWEVKHDCTETVEGLSAFRGSKYVQSRIGDSLKSGTILEDRAYGFIFWDSLPDSGVKAFFAERI